MRAKISARYRQNRPNGVFFHVTKEEIFMQLSDKIKKFSVEQAIDYLNKNPVKNLPKLLDWADMFCAGKFEGQRRAISLEGDETTTDSRRSEEEINTRTKSKLRIKERKANCVQRTQKHRLPSGRRCFFQPSRQGENFQRAERIQRKNVHGRTLPCTFRVRWGFPGLALRRVSRAGRGPGSGCAAARGRGPGAACRRHSPGRGSAAGCAERRLRLP